MYVLIDLDPNFTDVDETSPLRIAAHNGSADILKLLLFHGAKDELDANGCNIVFYAAKGEHIDCLQELAAADIYVDFDVVSLNGKQPDSSLDPMSQAAQFIKITRNNQRVPG